MARNPERRNALDPAVAEMLSELDRKQRFASLPRARQEKARRDAARHRVGLDLPPTLHEALRRIAREESISMSGLVTFLLYRGVTDHSAGQVELSPYKRPSRSLNFDFLLDFTEFEKP